jgi:hypothetical protein
VPKPKRRLTEAPPIEALPIMDGHHPLGPSAAAKWMGCNASVWMEAGIPEPPSSPAAAEGTAAHEEAEKVLRELLAKCVVYPEAQEYVDYVHELVDNPYIEQWVSYSDWVPGAGGTADAIGFEGTTCHVIDLKYGKGIRVDAPGNPQGLLYCLGTYQHLSWLHTIEKFVFHIHQPRLGHISIAEYTVEEVLAFGDRAKAASDIIHSSKELTPIPGIKQCQWCKAKGICPQQRDMVLAIATEEFQDVEF